MKEITTSIVTLGLRLPSGRFILKRKNYSFSQDWQKWRATRDESVHLALEASSRINHARQISIPGISTIVDSIYLTPKLQQNTLVCRPHSLKNAPRGSDSGRGGVLAVSNIVSIYFSSPMCVSWCMGLYDGDPPAYHATRVGNVLVFLQSIGINHPASIWIG